MESGDREKDRYLVAMEMKSGTTIYNSDSMTAAATVPPPNGFQGTPAGAAFNAAGTHVATVWTTYNETRVASISLSDGSIVEHTFAGNLTMSPVTGNVYLGPAVEWLPDGSGWLLFGRNLVDASTGRRLWIIDSEGLNGTARRQLLPDGLLVRTGGFDLETGKNAKVELKVIKWPHAEVQQSLMAMNGTAPAKLKAGTAIGVTVEIGTLKYGQPDETRTSLEKAFQERVAADGMLPGDTSGAVLYAHYSEMDGQELFQRGRPGRPNRNAPPQTGTGIQSTVAVIKLEFRLPGESRPVWSDEVVVNPSALVIRGEATAANARDAMFRAAQWQITAAPIPYFIPEDKALAILPGQTIYDSR